MDILGFPLNSKNHYCGHIVKEINIKAGLSLIIIQIKGQNQTVNNSNFVLSSSSSSGPQTSTSSGLSKGVSAQCLFDLLVSLEGETHDALDALELVKAEKPLRSLGELLLPPPHSSRSPSPFTHCLTHLR